MWHDNAVLYISYIYMDIYIYHICHYIHVWRMVTLGQLLSNDIWQTVFASSVLDATPVTITIYESSWHADTFQKFHHQNPQPVPSKVTVSIISPPPKKGGDDLKSSARPHKKPMPVGPHILWPGCESWFWYKLSKNRLEVSEVNDGQW